jgi:hypothetical protein
MTDGWGGSDPVGVIDAGDYELGTEYSSLVDVTITKIRVWAPANAVAFPGRTGTIWSTTGTVLATATLAASLPSGWSSYTLASPLGRAAGQRWVVSYTTGGNYGVVDHALDSTVLSSDNSISALSSATATNGNGVFNTTPATFPTTGNSAHFFYGADVEFDLGLPGQSAPTITGIALQADGLAVIASVTATDPETLVGASYAVEWGDGDTDVNSTGSFTHTYTTAGLKAVLAKVTDTTAKTDYAAAAIELFDPVSGLDMVAVQRSIVGHAAKTGLFRWINTHEPKNAPSNALGAAIWVDRLAPLPGASSLNRTSALAVVSIAVLMNMLSEPQDGIDARMVGAVSMLFTAYSGDFELGGNVRNIDLLGAYSDGLSMQAGYREQDGKLYRAMVISLPLVINDAWTQSA